ncbi:hypothetical protein H5410_012667 [Solanum commersonii]|uniref:Uncharacterized protein n=1 Tax=Solanum commersonii TaxID=4109 RepID=A0A9J6AT08_SOLCO|nr:hypothetical protein H5410_012667 [Solanum commersonii]
MGESSNCTNKAGNEEFMMVHNSGKGNSQVSRPKALAMPITLPYQNGFEILAKARDRTCDKRKRIVLFQFWRQARDKKTEGLPWSTRSFKQHRDKITFNAGWRDIAFKIA